MAGKSGYGNNAWDEERDIAGEARSTDLRWSAKGKAKVTHPMWGEVIVPCASKLAAVRCAAEVWGADWAQLMDAKVEACDQSLPAEKRPTRQEIQERRAKERQWMVIHSALGYVYVKAEDVTQAIWEAAKQWGKDPRLAEFHQGCVVRERR